jgi:hypothetical protein
MSRAPPDDGWSEAIAVGSLAFVEKVKSELGVKAMHRELVQLGGGYALRGAQRKLTRVNFPLKILR